MSKFVKSILSYISRWVNPDYHIESESVNVKKGIDWVGATPFLFFHVMCFGIIWVGFSPFAIWFAVIFYFIRMFGITAFYHRYFSHHAFTSNRFFSFLFAFLGATAVQRGPLWWAAIHRHHHLFADTKDDVHSPLISGFWYSHIGWLFARENKRTRIEYLKDWLKFPELVFLDKFQLLGNGWYGSFNLFYRRLSLSFFSKIGDKWNSVTDFGLFCFDNRLQSRNFFD